MREVWLRVLTNLKKSKAQAACLFLLVGITAALLSLVLLLTFTFNAHLEDQGRLAKTPHFLLVEDEKLYNQRQKRYLNEYPGVEKTETEKTVSVVGSILEEEGELPAQFLFYKASAEREMSLALLKEGQMPKASYEVCVPYLFSTRGYEVGDSLHILLPSGETNYTISGFFEDLSFGSVYGQNYQFYLSETGYAKVCEKGFDESLVLRVRMANPQDGASLNKDFVSKFFAELDFEHNGLEHIISTDWNQSKLSRTFVLDLTAVILLFFTALSFLVTLFAVWLRVKNNISEGIHNIAALKVIGFTGQQMFLVLVLQYCGLVIIATIVGIAASYVVIPLYAQIFDQLTTIRWSPGFDPLCSLMVFAVLVIMMSAMVLVSARKILALSALEALRQGLPTHSFKKNYFPADQTRGSLALILALKSSMQSKGHVVVTFIIMAILSFALVIEGSMSNNLEIRSDLFSRVLIGELPDARFFANNNQEAENIRQFVSTDSNIRKMYYSHNVDMLVADNHVASIVTDDFDSFEGALLSGGRYPKHDNEICISGSLARQSNLKIGDTVSVTKSEITALYLIVGMIQTMDNDGLVCAMTLSGVRNVHPNFELSQLLVYLHDTDKAEELVNRVNERFSSVMQNSVDFRRSIDAHLVNYSSALFWVTLILMGVTIALLAAVLYLVLKSFILMRWHELGILRALGFSEMQLINHLSLSLMPTIVAGLAIGGASGALLYNPLLVVLTSSLGIFRSSLPTPTLLAVFVCMALAFLAYAFIMLLARKIHYLTAYDLVAE